MVGKIISRGYFESWFVSISPFPALCVIDCAFLVATISASYITWSATESRSPTAPKGWAKSRSAACTCSSPHQETCHSSYVFIRFFRLTRRRHRPSTSFSLIWCRHIFLFVVANNVGSSLFLFKFVEDFANSNLFLINHSPFPPWGSCKAFLVCVGGVYCKAYCKSYELVWNTSFWPQTHSPDPSAFIWTHATSKWTVVGWIHWGLRTWCVHLDAHLSR